MDYPRINKKDRFLCIAMGVALSSKAKMKHGAIVVRHGKILGSGTNIVKNSPKYVDWRYSSIHAEVVAMKRAGWPRRCTLYVARVNRQGLARFSQPCSSCQTMLDSFNCKVIYTEG